MVAVDVRAIADTLMLSGQQDDVLRVVLREACHQLGWEPESDVEAERAWRDFSGSARYPILQAVARDLLSKEPEARLDEIDKAQGRLSGRRMAEFWLPRPVADKLAELVSDAASVRLAFEAALHPALRLALSAKGGARPVRYLFVAPNPGTCELARMCAVVLGVDLDVVQAGPFARQDRDGFDAEVALPPINAKIDAGDEASVRSLQRLGVMSGSRQVSSEALAIADVLAHAKGRAVVVLPNGAMFRMVGLEPTAREALVRSGRLVGILSAPGGMLYPTIGVGMQVLVLDREGEGHNRVRFVNLDDDRFASRTVRGRPEPKAAASWREALDGPLRPGQGFARDVPVAELARQSFVLSAERYVLTRAGERIEALLGSHETARLSDVAELVRPAALVKSEDGEFTVYEASPGDIGERGTLRRPAKESRVDLANMRAARQQQVRPGDVLLSIKGTIGKAGLVTDEAPREPTDGFWTAGQSLMIIRPKDGLSAAALYEYLSDPAVQEHLGSLAGGAYIQALSVKDLRGLKVPIPDAATQREVEAAFARRQDLYDEVERVQRTIIEERAGVWPHRELSP